MITYIHTHTTQNCIEGNQMLRNLVRDNVPRYMAARTKNDKGKIIVDVLESVKRNSPSGAGLVRQNQETGLWSYIGNEKAKDKIGHALRKASRDFIKELPQQGEGRRNFDNHERRISLSSAVVSSSSLSILATTRPRIESMKSIKSIRGTIDNNSSGRNKLQLLSTTSESSLLSMTEGPLPPPQPQFVSYYHHSRPYSSSSPQHQPTLPNYPYNHDNTNSQHHHYHNNDNRQYYRPVPKLYSWSATENVIAAPVAVSSSSFFIPPLVTSSSSQALNNSKSNSSNENNDSNVPVREVTVPVNRPNSVNSNISSRSSNNNINGNENGANSSQQDQFLPPGSHHRQQSPACVSSTSSLSQQHQQQAFRHHNQPNEHHHHQGHAQYDPNKTPYNNYPVHDANYQQRPCQGHQRYHNHHQYNNHHNHHHPQLYKCDEQHKHDHPLPPQDNQNHNKTKENIDDIHQHFNPPIISMSSLVEVASPYFDQQLAASDIKQQKHYHDPNNSSSSFRRIFDDVENERRKKEEGANNNDNKSDHNDDTNIITPPSLVLSSSSSPLLLEDNNSPNSYNRTHSYTDCHDKNQYHHLHHHHLGPPSSSLQQQQQNQQHFHDHRQLHQHHRHHYNPNDNSYHQHPQQNI